MSVPANVTLADIFSNANIAAAYAAAAKEAHKPVRPEGGPMGFQTHEKLLEACFPAGGEVILRHSQHEGEGVITVVQGQGNILPPREHHLCPVTTDVWFTLWGCTPEGEWELLESN